MPRETTEAASGSLPDQAPLAVAVGATAGRLQAEYLGSRGEHAQRAARASLAELRRAAGSTPELRPLVFQVSLDVLRPTLLEKDVGRGDAASPAERAAFDALTLFALHMQSATAPMHVRDRSFGSAMSVLRSRRDSGSLKPRFDAMLAARDERSRLTHARSLVTLLRAERIGLDYGLLAADLRTLSGRYRSGVLLRWGRDVARPAPRADSPADSDGAGAPAAAPAS